MPCRMPGRPAPCAGPDGPGWGQRPHRCPGRAPRAPPSRPSPARGGRGQLPSFESPAMNSLHRKPLPGTQLDWYDAREAAQAPQPGVREGLPYAARVHTENIVRRAPPPRINDYLGQLVRRERTLDFPWFPARVVCHDILGQTALVDLAGLRDAIAGQGGAP